MADSNDDNQVTRKADGRFIKPPKSPGRPVGPTRAERVAAFIEPHIEPILQKAVELARLGDPVSMKLILERFAPLARPEAEKITIPGMSEASTLEAKTEVILHAVATGQISAEVGNSALAMLERVVKLVMADDLAQRVQALENKTTTTRTVIDATSGDVIDAEFQDLA